MKKIIIFIISALMLINIFSVSSFAVFTKTVEVDGNIAYVISADENGGVLYDKNSELSCDPGELVKLVTGILVIENCSDLSQKVTASSTAIRRIEALRVTTAGILVGETMTVEELLYCMLVYNANDAASVLAEFIAGSETKFVEMMNGFAQRLELKSTLFSNPGGYIHDNQYSTARDIAKIFRYCLNNSAFFDILSTFLYEMPATNKYSSTRYLKNTNYLINYAISDYYMSSVKCGKSGYTETGRCNCVSFASKDGYNYICVVMDASMKNNDEDEANENMSFVDSKDLLSWAFDNLRLRVVANTSTYVGEVKVRLSSDYDYVSLVPIADVSALVPSGVNAGSVLIEPISELTTEVINAPVKKGDILGRAAIKYAGTIVAEVDLVAAFDVKLSTPKYIGDKIFSIIKSPVFIIIALFLLLVVLPLSVVAYYNKKKKDRIKRFIKRNSEKRNNNG